MTLRRIMFRSWKEFDWNRPFDQFLSGMSALSAKTAQTEAHLAAASAGNQLARRLLVSEKQMLTIPKLYNASRGLLSDQWTRARPRIFEGSGKLSVAEALTA